MREIEDTLFVELFSKVFRHDVGGVASCLGSIPIRKRLPLPTFHARLSPTTVNEEIIAF